MPRNFTINEVPISPGVAPPEDAREAPDLGPLKAFTGNFTGRGYNMIFRPHNPSLPTGLDIEPAPIDNVLELNLTVETLSFHDRLGRVPNRGFRQGDIDLNGVPYLQSISDVTDPTIITPIHLEPGLWLIVPPTEHPDIRDVTFARLASIPHGTTINAQGKKMTIAGPPEIEPVDITPFGISDGVKHRFDSQTVTNVGTARIPQDLSVAPAITQQLLDDPNLLLRQHIDGATIVSTDEIKIDTSSTEVPLGGGTENIAFLVGFFSGPNANAARMSATFWIETVQVQIEVGPLKAGETAKISPTAPPGAPVPSFAVTSTEDVDAPRSVTVTYPQIQYTQNVSLNFADLTWPHVSVATLVPEKPIAVEL